MSVCLKIDYISTAKKADIQTSDTDNFSWGAICRYLRDRCAAAEVYGNHITLPWHDFLALKVSIADLIQNVCRAKLELTESATDRLRDVTRRGYYAAVSQMPLEETQLMDKLHNAGFIRPLTAEQRRNVCKLGAMPAGATFSVPGAGKTTEALAYFFYHACESDRLLVVAPKNAFGAWDEQLDACVKDQYGKFVRLTGGENAIQAALAKNPKFSIISYAQFPIVRSCIAEFLEQNQVFMFLDESHRIKAGTHGVAAESIISISHLPIRKLILSGTPMPQAETDLNPQISFLYPDVSLEGKQVTELIRPIYVRTTKRELDLPDPIVEYVSLSLMPKQAIFYQLLKSEAYRQALNIPRSSKRYIRQLGRSIIKLMQFASNPALLIRDIDFMFSPELSELLLEEESPKIEYACNRARELAAHNQKCIIWTSFVNNVELIARRLSDLGADYIHGGVDAGSEQEADTREGKIRRFHEDKNAFVLVANPAAAAEGISLHTVCHTAIYVDRSFNAAQYLQSVDRIHRLGVGRDIEKKIEILECINTVDQVTSSRLAEKINRMARVLNDSSLSIEYDPYAFENDINAGGIDISDVQEILQYLGGDTSD